MCFSQHFGGHSVEFVQQWICCLCYQGLHAACAFMNLVLFTVYFGFNHNVMNLSTELCIFKGSLRALGLVVLAKLYK